MTAYVFPPVNVTSLPVKGSDKHFPIRRVFAIGQNYADHAVEMGAVPEKKTPLFFTKPADAVVAEGGDIPYPSMTENLHHEVELVVALKSGGTNIPVEKAEGHIFGYGTGIDFTRRDLQKQAKEKGRPWDVAKAFDHSAPVSALTRVEDCGYMRSGTIRLTVNSDLRQQGHLDQMIWSVPEIIHELSRYFALKAGDLIFTGTPAGVGPVIRGDHLVAEIGGLDPLIVRVGA